MHESSVELVGLWRLWSSRWTHASLSSEALMFLRILYCFKWKLYNIIHLFELYTIFSIASGLSDPSPRDSPTHVVVGRLSDHDYISIKSRESPAPRGGIIINIENLGKSALNQYSIQKSDLNNSSSRTNSLILSPPRILEDINGNHSNNNDTTEAVEITIENSGARSVEPDNEMTCNSLSPRSESLL